MLYVGIDIGLDGAVAFLDPPDVTVQTVPTIGVGKKGRREYDLQGLVQLVELKRGHGQELFVVMESLNAFPGQGVTSMFSLGRGLGTWEGILSALGIPYQKVHPAVWKRALITGVAQGKGASIVVAKRLFPNLDFPRKGDHNKADAVLLAEYGRRTSGIQGA